MVKMHVSKKQVINFHRVYPDQHQVFQDPAAAIELQHRTIDDYRTTGAAAQRVRQAEPEPVITSCIPFLFRSTVALAG